MARYAEIEDTIITNIFLADAEFVAAHKPEAIECPDFVGVGDEYKNGEFSRLVNLVRPDQANAETL